MHRDVSFYFKCKKCFFFTETSDTAQSEESDSNMDDFHDIAMDVSKPSVNVHQHFIDIHKTSTDVHKITPEGHKTKIDVHKTTEKRKTNMADRPLPVPVENEPYYMDIERSEAENLLMGHPDGTFVLRPSSQVSFFQVVGKHIILTAARTKNKFIS